MTDLARVRNNNVNVRLVASRRGLLCANMSQRNASVHWVPTDRSHDLHTVDNLAKHDLEISMRNQLRGREKTLSHGGHRARWS